MANTSRQADRNQPITIPVCFHVFINEDIPAMNLSDSSLKAQLDTLNQAFTSSSCCDPSTQTWCTPEQLGGSTCSGDTGIRFAMAQLNADKTNVLYNNNRIPHTTTSLSSPEACVIRREDDNNYSIGRNKEQRRATLRMGGIDVMNVFFLILADRAVGEAHFPWDATESPDQDAVDVLFRTLPGGTEPKLNLGHTLVHEAGHWLGLVHTFQGSCDVSDGILGTAPELTPNYGCDVSQGIRDSCSEPEDHPLAGRPDPIFNFMDYSDDACMYEFTWEQARLMRACWDVYRLGRPSEAVVDTRALALGSKEKHNLLPKAVAVFEMNVSLTRSSSSLACQVNAIESNLDLYIHINKPKFDTSADCKSDDQRTATHTKSCFVSLPASPAANSNLRLLASPHEHHFEQLKDRGLLFWHRCGNKGQSSEPMAPTVAPQRQQPAPTRAPTWNGSSSPETISTIQSVAPSQDPTPRPIVVSEDSKVLVYASVVHKAESDRSSATFTIQCAVSAVSS